jgi:tetratricopeptide (TPR) repeat protein
MHLQCPHCNHPIGLLVKLSKDHPSKHSYRRELANAHTCYAVALTSLRRFEGPDSADEHTHQAVTIAEQLAQDYPSIPDYRDSAAYCHIARAEVLMRLARFDGPDSTEEHLQRAIELLERLLTDFPTVGAYRFKLATALGRVARLPSDRLRSEEMLKHYRRSAEILEELIAEPNCPVEYQRELANVYSAAATLHGLEPQQKLEWSTKADNALRPLFDKRPNDAKLGPLLRWTPGARAAALEQLGRHSEALRLREEGWRCTGPSSARIMPSRCSS